MKWIAWSFAGIVLLGGLAFAYFQSHQQSDFKLAAIKRGTIVESVYGIGTVKAHQNYTLKIGVPAVINHLWIEEGDSVEAGQQLVELRDVKTFFAPFAGVVTNLGFEVGETVFPQVPILTLTNFKSRYLLVSLEQTGAIRVKKGQKARLNFDGFRETSFSGTVESVYSSGDKFWVRIAVGELPKSILPGMSADVAIIIGERAGVLLAPVAAITLSKVTLKDGKEVEVKTGILDNEMIEIISGDIREGQEVRLSAVPRP